MTTWQAMNALEGLGYRFALAQGEKVQATLQGRKPREASALLDIVRRDRDSATAYVRERESGTIIAADGCRVSLLDALAIAQAVKAGEARLLGKVVCHPRDVSVRWEPLTGETSADLLRRRRERFITALQARIKAMDESEYWKLSVEEYDQFCARYGRYCRLLEEGS